MVARNSCLAAAIGTAERIRRAVVVSSFAGLALPLERPFVGLALSLLANGASSNPQLT